MDSINVAEWLKKNANVLIIVAIGLVLGLAFLRKPSQEQVAPPAGDYSGLATDSQGRPIIYRDVSSKFINVHKTIEGSYNVVAPNVTQPVASAPSTPDTETPQEYPIEPVGYVRTRYSSSIVKEYDKSHPQGIPIRNAPGGKEIAYAPYGSEVKITGEPVKGKSNLPGAGGSNLWFPVEGGYVSKYDLDVANA